MLQRESELANLKNQLNPHFLFNALNSIRALTLSDPHNAREMLTLLADLLRVSLSVNQYNLIRVQDEMNIVQDYIALEAMRFEERLITSIHISEEAMTARIPTFCVQLLVENAIKHGLAKREQATLISIEIIIDNQQLIIAVNNSGIYQPGASAGTGLQNLKQRLAIMYQDRASFQITQKPLEQVSAIISLPVEYD
ncbi:MAG: histidine kinase [Bacteroidota bacterium]